MLAQPAPGLSSMTSSVEWTSMTIGTYPDQQFLRWHVKLFSLGSNPSETKGNPLTLLNRRHNMVRFYTSDPAPYF